MTLSSEKTPSMYSFYSVRKNCNSSLHAGVYNSMKRTEQQNMSVQLFLDKVSHADELVEANMSTIFQSIWGTKQYWFLRSSLRCMLREWGTPTLFPTFSCAEYESPEIGNYPEKMNQVQLSSWKAVFSDMGTLNGVEDCLKSRKNIYHYPRAEQETRVNDYNPLLLLL